MGKQHYLSQMYLRGFSLDEKNIFCYDRKVERFIKNHKLISEKAPKIVESGLVKNLGCKGNNFWSKEIEKVFGSIFEDKVGGELNELIMTDNFKVFSHGNLIQFIMMQLIRSQIAGDASYDFIKKEIVQCRKSVKENFGEDISESDIRSNILDSFISRIVDNSDIGGFGSFRNRKIYLSRISGERQFISTNFPFIHSGRDLYFPLTSKWIAFITIEENPIIELDKSIDFNNFRVELFNHQFANSHIDNRYIFGKKEDIEKLTFG